MSLRSDERLYFIHIPKTAGTTLTPIIDMHFAEREICPAQLWREFVHLRQEDLPRYRLFRGHFGAGGLNSFLPEPPVLMTMLRAPIPLAVSTYKFIKREPGTRVHKLVSGEDMSLSDFLTHPRTRGKVSNKQTRHLSFDLEHDPDSGPIFLNRESRAAVDQWVKDHKTRIKPADRLDRARSKLLECRFFGLVERFEESMLLMSHTFGWAPIGPAQKLMVAPENAQRAQISDEDRERIVELNRWDMQLYEFAEREFDRRIEAMHAELDAFQAASPERDLQRDIFGDPELDAAYRQLDRRYQAQREAQEPAPLERIRVTFDEALDGDGWHRREASSLDGSTFRWTGPQERSTIDLPISSNDDVRLTLCIINVLDEAILRDMRVYANDIEIDLHEIEACVPGRVFQGEIASPIIESSSAMLRVTIETPFTVRPCDCESHSPDERQVGLAVNWIDLSPAGLTVGVDVPPAPVSPHEAERRRERKRQVVMRSMKHRVAQLPVIGPKLRSAYIRMKNR